MSKWSEQDLKYASELREEIHREALIKAKALYPDIVTVVDRHPVEDYFQESWDYPGKWYPVVAIPYGYHRRSELIEEIVRNTVESYLKNRGGTSSDPFYEVIARYPDSVLDFAIVFSQTQVQDVNAHYEALMKGAARIMGDNSIITFQIGSIKAKEISTQALFAPADKNKRLNYRTAFLFPPHPNRYTDADFDAINAALFPLGTEKLEAFEWSTDWSDYFDDGNEWWGTLCLTVFDGNKNRFVVIMASATD